MPDRTKSVATRGYIPLTDADLARGVTKSRATLQVLMRRFAFGLRLHHVLALLQGTLESWRGILVWDPG
ncbi:hypothetical protein SORBI_3001G270500 [Sorghum bicolor]|uniref:Uncharacterized protein n=1 Tax=Sorghum bicolor TaxID=4558 RepID=A0A1B6QLE1_SORBI|nr:hypothetical protein SORBI_3001G270500 [Sorghum bicolor]